MNSANVYLFIHFRVVRSGSKISCLAFLCPSTVLFRLYLFDTLWIILFVHRLEAELLAHVRFPNAPHCTPLSSLPSSSKLGSVVLPVAQRCALWNLFLEFSGLHYCLFVKVLNVIHVYCCPPFRWVAKISYHSRSPSVNYFLFLFSVVVRCFPQQRIWVYHPHLGLSTDFFIFFHFFSFFWII